MDYIHIPSSFVTYMPPLVYGPTSEGTCACLLYGTLGQREVLVLIACVCVCVFAL
jgi:hypothetical protein